MWQTVPLSQRPWVKRLQEQLFESFQVAHLSTDGLLLALGSNAFHECTLLSGAEGLCTARYYIPTIFQMQQHPVIKELAAKIRKMRLERGISQEELSYRSGLHRTAMGKIELGLRDPKLVTLLKIAENGFKIPITELLKGISLKGRR
jgi:DNA-binding XRE family transcriptional regulator